MFQYYVHYKNMNIVVFSRLSYLDFLSRHSNIAVSAEWKKL